MTDRLFSQAYAAHRGGDFSQAKALYRVLLEREPGNFDALFLMGVLLSQAGDFAEADRFMTRAVAANPASRDALQHHGLVLQRLNRPEAALAAFESALALDPGFSPAAMGRADTLSVLGRIEDAVTAYDAVLAVNEDVRAFAGRGRARLALGRHAEAAADFDRALALDPGSAQLHSGRGVALAGLRHFADAVASFDRALADDPRSVRVRLNRAAALTEWRHFAEAARDYEILLAQDPFDARSRGLMLYCRMQVCDWRGLEGLRDIALAQLRAGQPAIPPFVIAALSDTAEDHLFAAREAAQAQKPVAPLWRGEVYVHEKIRVAYLSADFRTHAVASVLAGIIEAHDRTRIESIGVSLGADDGSLMRARLMRGFDTFLDVRGMSDEAIAQRLKAMEVDIAVDLMGYTADSRPGILARRPAPVQVNYLGFAGTMGAPWIDYIIADAVTIPDGERAFYSESVVRLPGTYMPGDIKRQVTTRRFCRADAGLPETGFVFCCFNSAYKLNPAMFDIWMRLLHEIGDSVLWLHRGCDGVREALIAEAEARGIAAARLVFAESLPTQEEHWARMALADLFLDTIPCNAQATANDALWTGLPLLTATGGAFTSRIAASQLYAAGFPELVAESLQDYEKKALALARERGRLQEIRARLADKRRDGTLFDAPRFARGLEAAYTAMRERQRRGQAPTDITVPASA